MVEYIILRCICVGPTCNSCPTSNTTCYSSSSNSSSSTVRKSFIVYIPSSVFHVLITFSVCLCSSETAPESAPAPALVSWVYYLLLLIMLHLENLISNCYILFNNSLDTDVYGQAASNLVAGNTLESTVQQILDMGGGSWTRDTVVRALRAAFNNPERAVEYLYSVGFNLLFAVVKYLKGTMEEIVWFDLWCSFAWIFFEGVGGGI